MTPYPVHYSVERPQRFTRSQLLARFIAVIALGLLGMSYAVVFAFAFFALPVFAASRITSPETAEAYLRDDGPRVVRGLRWFAAVCAWLGLNVDRLPTSAPGELVTLTIDDGAAQPTAAHSPIRRAITGLPSALVLAVLCWLGVFVWLWAALSILVRQRVGRGAHGYLVGLQRWTIRLLAYQASLVDDYPPFSFSDPRVPLPEARATA